MMMMMMMIIMIYLMKTRCQLINIEGKNRMNFNNLDSLVNYSDIYCLQYCCDNYV